MKIRITPDRYMLFSAVDLIIDGRVVASTTLDHGVTRKSASVQKFIREHSHKRKPT